MIIKKADQKHLHNKDQKAKAGIRKKPAGKVKDNDSCRRNPEIKRTA